jgi:hypothetical protein
MLGSTRVISQNALSDSVAASIIKKCSSLDGCTAMWTTGRKKWLNTAGLHWTLQAPALPCERVLPPRLAV